MKAKINRLQKILNIKFNNTDLLLQAVTHKSYNSKINYEMLEFLGDRVLGLIISNKLFALYPDEKVGVLDKRFPIPWEDYYNSLLLTNDNGLNKIPTKIHSIIDTKNHKEK